MHRLRGTMATGVWLTAGAPTMLATALHLAVAPAAGQAPDRLWGEVVTSAGERHTGYLRWDRNEAVWVDLLDGQRRLDPDVVDRIALALGDEAPVRERSVEFLGVRISWDDDEGASLAGTAIRFGHLETLRRLGTDRAVLGLKGGGEVEFTASSTDLGDALRDLVVEVPGAAPVTLQWRDLDRIAFGPAPADAPDPDAFRLHGTVEDRWGGRWTGYLSWDRDEALSSDILDGEENGAEREIRFELVAAIDRREEGGARVVLRNGRELVLTGTNDVDDGHRGLQVADPGLGRIDIPWESFASVRFHPPADPLAYDRMQVPGALMGVVETEGGERFTGRVVWDADEAAAWEMLDGEWRGIGFSVEFDAIATVEKLTSRSARITLRDGRVLELGGSNDVDRGNKGIAVEGSDGTFAAVDWRDFRRLELGAGDR